MRQALSLAGEEWLGNGHSVDKHVGKTDQQLVQRLRDQAHPRTESWPLGRPRIGAASTFEDMQRAQRLTQYCIDSKDENIRNWLSGQPDKENERRSLISETPDGEPSGQSVSKKDFKADGLKAESEKVQNVKVVLEYDDDLNPPFTVLTSMPTNEHPK